MNTYKGLQGGQKVKFKVYDGMGIDGPKYAVKIAKVNPMLIFDDHVCVNHGWAGTVVDDRNFMGIVGEKA